MDCWIDWHLIFYWKEACIVTYISIILFYKVNCQKKIIINFDQVLIHILKVVGR